MTEQRTIDATLAAGAGPATVESLAADLRALGLPAGGIVLVHTALSRLGYVVGGAQALIEAVLEALGPEGTLVMPAFSGDRGDPAPWRHPPVPEAWWPVFREHMPAYHPARTPTRALGVVPEAFRQWPGVRRSAHPSVSFAAHGPAARAITEGHELAYGMGEGSPLARLYEHDAWVLLLGVTHANDSSLHLSEIRAEGIRLDAIEAGAPLRMDGARRWVRYPDVDGDSDDFEALGEAFAAETGAERTGRVGIGTARLFAQRAVVDFGVRWLETHRRA